MDHDDDRGEETAAFRARLARQLRGLRWAGAGIAVLYVLQLLRQGYDGGPTRLWLGLAGAVGLLTITNLASRRWDVGWGHGDARQLVETWADAVAMLLFFTVLAPLVAYQSFPVGALVVVGEAALRLSRRRALAVALILGITLAVVRTTDPFPWPVAPDDVRGTDLIATVITPLLLVWLVSWGVSTLEAMRASADAAHRDLAASHQRVSAQQEELQRTVSQLEAANRELQSVRDQLEQFSGVVAHDLINPISTAQGLAGMVGGDMSGEVRAQVVTRIEASLDRALRLIERLREYARSTNSELRLAPTDLNRLLQSVMDDHSAVIVESGAEVRQLHLLPQVGCDEILIGQVLGNLIGNAIRHGTVPGRTLVIEIDAHPSDDGVLITVADNGPGLPPDRLDRLFEAGVRAESRRAGLGLGLATCRSAVQRHGGRIWTERSHLGGAAFTFTLPAPVVPAAEEPDTAGATDRRGTR